MAGLGSVYVELELDRSKFNRSLQQLETDAKAMPVQIEDAFKNLGIKSSYQFDLMRERAETMFERIKNAANATGQDRLNAEKARNDQLTRINEEQYGKQESLLTMLKNNWLAASAAIVGAWYTASKAFEIATAPFLKFADQVRDLSYVSGGSARDVSVLVSGLDDLGVSAETVERAMNRMSRAVSEGDPILNRLRISTRDLAGQHKTGLELFYETIDALGKVQNSTERSRLAQDLYGKQWIQMTEAVRVGVDQIKRMGEENAALGKVMTEEGIKAAKEYTLAVKDLGNAWEGFWTRVGSNIIPALTSIFKAMTPVKAQQEDYNKLLGEYVLIVDYLKTSGAAPGHIPGMLPDVAAGMLNRSVGTGPAAQETPEEMKRRLQLEGELSALRASTRSALAISFEDQLAANLAVINSQRQTALDKLKTDWTKTEEEKGRLSVAINAQFDAMIFSARYKAEQEAAVRRQNITKASLEVDAREQAMYATTVEGILLNAVNILRQIPEFGEELSQTTLPTMQSILGVSGETGKTTAEWLEIERVKREQVLAIMKDQYELETRHYEEAYARLFETANAVGGEMGKGLGMMTSGLKGLTDIERGQDKWSKEYEVAENHFLKMNMLYENDAENRWRIDAASYQRQVAQDRMYEQQRYAMMENTAQLGAGAMLAMYNATGQKHKEMFAMYKAFMIATAIAGGAAGIARAWGENPYWIAIAITAAIAASTAAQIASIAALEPGGGNVSASAPTSAGGYSYVQPTEPTYQKAVEGPRPMDVTIHVYGSYIGDKDEFARDISDALRKAQEDRA